jgi:hypothetical protein
MDTIRFETTVGEDHVIRPPEGVTIPPGRVEVTVSPCAVPVEPETPDGATLREKLLAWAALMEKLQPDLPTDLAANHDFYAHGKPRE